MEHGVRIYGELAWVGGSGNPELAQEISAALGEPLLDVRIAVFPNENIFIQLLQTVRSKDVFIIQPIVAPVQEHLVEEVQAVYRTQGAPIHDKHIEINIRQMLRRITVIESGDTSMLPGELVDRNTFETQNRQMITEGRMPAQGRPVLMGITKASLATESWLSAASFQETTKVLTDAAIQGKSDTLKGLKENVILGKLIPAGTGLDRYRNIRVGPTEEARASAYTMSYDPYDYSFGADVVGPAVPLDEMDFGEIR